MHDHKGLEEGAVLPPIWRSDKHLAKIEFAMYRKKIAQAEARRGHLQARVSPHRRRAGRPRAPPGRSVRTAAPRRTLTTTRARAAAKATWKSPRTSTTRTRDLAHMVLSLKPFGCMPSHAVRRRAVGGRVALQGHDLPAHRNLRRRRHQRPQPRADGARRSQGQDQARIQGSARFHRPHAGRDSRSTWTSIRNWLQPCIKTPHTKGVVGAAANFVLHIAERMKAEGWQPRRSSAAA